MLPPDFIDDVYRIVQLIPRGKVTSYGAIAKSLGVAKSSRMVGWALNKASVTIPAHRVVNRNGLLTGKAAFGQQNEMKKLLEQEGISVVDDKVVDFEKYFWDPISLGDALNF